MNMANMVWRRKTLVDGIRKEVAAEGGSVLLLPVATLTLACPSPTYRMPNLIFAV